MLEPQSHGGKGSNRRVHTSPYSGTWTLDASVSRTTSIVLSGIFDAYHRQMYTGYEYSA